MKTTKLLSIATAAFLVAGGAMAQEKNPLTITGSVKPRTQLSLEDGTGYANLSSGPGGSTFLRFADKLSPYTNLVIKFGAPYLDDRSGTAYNSTTTPTGFDIAANSWLPGVGVQEAYGSTDVLGEMGMNQLVGLKFQAGMFKLKAPMFSRGMNFGLGSGDEGSRSEVFGNYSFPYPGASYESYKWSLEVPFTFLKDTFPLTIRVGSDLDLTGRKQKTGFTGYAEVGGRNLYLIDDLFVVDWVVYSTLKMRDPAPALSPSIDGGKIVGGVVSLGFGFDNGLAFGFGAAADYAAYSYKTIWPGLITLTSYDESNLNWQGGMDVSLKEAFKVSGALMHRNYFNLDVGTSSAPKSPSNFAQNFVAARADLLSVKTLTPYVGASYVLGYETVKTAGTSKVRGSPENEDALSWEAGLMWNLTANVEFDAGYTRGKNNALSTFGAVINAIEQSEEGAIFFRAGWKF